MATLLPKISAKSTPTTARMPQRYSAWGIMFARRAAASFTNDQDFSAVEAWVVKWVQRTAGFEGFGAVIGEGVLAQAIGEGDAFQKAGWNDAVSIDVILRHRHAAATDDSPIGLMPVVAVLMLRLLVLVILSVMLRISRLALPFVATGRP